MSLAHTAEYLKKHGRGPDDQLVHMSSNELRGLQTLAKAHGGSLTINPHTGLPEAGFLDAVLPMVLGAALTPFTGGLSAALLVGGGYGLAKHDLGAGLMAGLGAYGGAGLMEGLSAAGANTAANTAGETALTQAGSEAGLEAGKETATQTLRDEALKNAANEGVKLPTNYADMVKSQLTPDQIARGQAQNFLSDAANTSRLTPEAVQGMQSQVPNMSSEQALNTIKGTAQANASLAAPTTSFSAAGKGLASLGGEAGRSAFYAGIPQGTLPATLLSASNALTPSNVPNQLESPDSNPMGFARLSKDFKGYQPDQPNPYYKAQYANYAQNPYAPRQMAEGGMAMGGQPNQMYPMSQQEHTNFMDPTQLPASAMEVRNFEPATNPMTGDMTRPMRKGGIARYDLGGSISPIMDQLAAQDPNIARELAKQRGQQYNLASGGHLPSSAGIPDVGIFYDNNLTTKNLPAWNAAQAGYKQIATRSKVKGTDLPKTAIEKLGGDYSDTGASGGIATLGSYSDGGRLLKGPGDGMSDNIPAQIGKRQPARLADGEFVVPADVVSHLGNGSTEAGAKKLYSMMDKVRQARTGRKAQGKQINANKFLPA
jgi:hypothetical protein